MRALTAFLLLAATWLLWSGHTEPLLLAFGAVSCCVVLAITWRMQVVDRESHPYHLGLRPLVYLPWLAWEVVKANLHVARIVLSPSLPVAPRLVRVPASQKTAVGRVIHANSITLTPGTVSLDIEDGSILVHALTEEAASGVEGGAIDRRASWLEGAGE